MNLNRTDKRIVEDIMKKKKSIEGKLIYLVKWEGSAIPTWEPVERFRNTDMAAIRRFEARNEKMFKVTQPERGGYESSNSILDNTMKPSEHSTQVGDYPDDDFEVRANWDIDSPLSVKCIKQCEEKYYCEVEWNSRSDGTTPSNELVPYGRVRESYPELLIEFFEARLTLKKINLSNK
jgi:hypothetical protein